MVILLLNSIAGIENTLFFHPYSLHHASLNIFPKLLIDYETLAPINGIFVSLYIYCRENCYSFSTQNFLQQVTIRKQRNNQTQVFMAFISMKVYLLDLESHTCFVEANLIVYLLMIDKEYSYFLSVRIQFREFVLLFSHFEN